MKIAISLLLLCFVCFAASQSTSQEFIVTNLIDGEVQVAGIFTSVATTNGYVTVVVTAPYPVDVCFQEGPNAAGGTDLSVSCNKEGFIPGNVTGSSSSGSGSSSEDAEFDGASTGGAKRLLRRFFVADNAVTATQNLFLRTDSYTISATWSNQPEIPDNSTGQSGDVQINVWWTPCQNGMGPNCAYTTPTVAKADTPFQVTTIVGGLGTLISFKNKELLTSLAFVISPITAAFAADNSTIQAYVRRDAVPFIIEGIFDGNNNSTGNDLIGFTNPEQGDWYLLIITTQIFNLNITVQTSQGCNTTAGLFPSGSQCISAVNILANGTSITNTTTALVANGTTFSYPAAPITYFLWSTSHLLVGVVNSDHSDTDAPTLYASTVGIPSSNGSEFSAVSTTNQVNFLNVAAADDTTVSDWIISVESSSQDFEIWAGAGCANDCSGKGVCPEDFGSNGLCSCEDHYKDFECGTKTLKTIYIVLIAIGGAIVLAIAIGVPVGCYIKNRKRARYERV